MTQHLGQGSRCRPVRVAHERHFDRGVRCIALHGAGHGAAVTVVLACRAVLAPEGRHLGTILGGIRPSGLYSVFTCKIAPVSQMNISKLRMKLL